MARESRGTEWRLPHLGGFMRVICFLERAGCAGGGQGNTLLRRKNIYIVHGGHYEDMQDGRENISFCTKHKG